MTTTTARRIYVSNRGVGPAAITVLAWIATAVSPVCADEQKLAYGKHLSQECTSCHRPDSSGKGIPPIVGLKQDYFVTTLKFYKTGARENPVMNSVAQMLNDEQMEALAAYFEIQKPPAATAPARKK